MTIINTYLAGNGQNLVSFWISTIALSIVIIVAISLAIDSLSCHDLDHFLSYIFIIIITIAELIIVYSETLKDKRYPQIDVMLNDSVSYTELTDKYELVEQNGLIYTFKVKEGTAEYDKLMGELK